MRTLVTLSPRVSSKVREHVSVRDTEVGTHAFIVLGSLLGVRWATSLRTQDVDIAVPGINADLPSALDSLEMGFLPVSGLDPKSPTTSFKVRGQS